MNHEHKPWWLNLALWMMNDVSCVRAESAASNTDDKAMHLDHPKEPSHTHLQQLRSNIYNFHDTEEAILIK